MSDFFEINGGVTAPRGFVAGGIYAGIKANTAKKPDLAVIFAETDCVTAALYTSNKVQGAPITVTKEHLKASGGVSRAVIVNSGNANTCNANGIGIANETCRLLGEALNIPENSVLVASTGVIGQPMSIEPFREAIPVLTKNLSVNGNDGAARAIMTTDTRQKQAAVEFNLGASAVRIGAMCKGSGMICPNMATMLCFVTTDIAITQPLLDKALRAANDVSFSMVSVDGDTSTNDMVSVMADGLAGNKIISDENQDFITFQNALTFVMTKLAREIAKDGEGATKLITCEVVNAPDKKTAAAIAKSVIGSSLFKAAVFAADANWGRILCAIGYAGAEFDIDKIAVTLSSENGSLLLCENGLGANFPDSDAHNILLSDEITVSVNLSGGAASAVAWGCDLTYDYVRINAEYRS